MNAITNVFQRMNELQSRFEKYFSMPSSTLDADATNTESGERGFSDINAEASSFPQQFSVDKSTGGLLSAELRRTFSQSLSLPGLNEKSGVKANNFLPLGLSSSGSSTSSLIGLGERLLARQQRQLSGATAVTQQTDAVLKISQSEPHQAFPYQEEIQAAAKRYELPVALVRSIVQAESGFNRFAVSPKGAMGLMQLMPETAKRFNVDDPFNVAENLDGGARYLQTLLNQYKNDYARVLSAYNAGEDAVARTLQKEGVPVPDYKETQQYVKKVLNSYMRYSGVRP